jgi:cobalt transporter subunit CbtA
MFTKIFSSALLSGATAGLITGLLQLAFVQPVLLHAELYETGQLVHFGGQVVDAAQDIANFDPMRDGLSIMFTMAVYVGYALILTAAIAFAEVHGNEVSVRHGFLWGVAGFVAVQVAPGFTLAPEVPGVAAADVYTRQLWWFSTVGAAAIAMWLIAFGKSWFVWGFAIVLLVVPHVFGAPQPEIFVGPVPPEIGALFAARVFGVGFTAWTLTGLFTCYFWKRESERDVVADRA